MTSEERQLYMKRWKAANARRVKEENAIYRAVNADRLRVDNVATGVVGRFLRVSFTARPAGQRAALSEVEVLGQLASQ